ncbi:MAG: Oxidoreductase family, NAD-binding Rossmann fold, partial [Paenibacillus sp.]|nr:Oxidoreductase family, NAD-binding Rossmann fold [Paenibacillus sp.]
MQTESKVKFGVIGLGARGRGLLHNLLVMDDVEIPAVCDPYEDRLQEAL